MRIGPAPYNTRQLCCNPLDTGVHPVAREEAAGHGNHASDPDGGVQERCIVSHARDRDALRFLYTHLQTRSTL